MTRRPPAADPDEPGIPAAPADLPEGTAPPSRTAEDTSETMPPVEGEHSPEGDEPT